MASHKFWPRLRVGLLLYVLLMVAGGSWLTGARTTDWDDPLWVSVYPINADGRAATGRYIEQLRQDTFEPLATFFAEEADFFGLPIATPIRVDLGPVVNELPPEPPVGRNPLAVAPWSLALRYWAWRVDKGDQAATTDIAVFVKYYDPSAHRSLGHSLGLRKGLIGVVNAFAAADYAGSNNVIIAHELLHTVGATDKYDPSTSQPVYPEGIADPEQSPRYPQTQAEIMGGRIAISEHEAIQPRSLREVVIGEMTASEIHWIR